MNSPKDFEPWSRNDGDIPKVENPMYLLSDFYFSVNQNKTLLNVEFPEKKYKNRKSILNERKL